MRSFERARIVPSLRAGSILSCLAALALGAGALAGPAFAEPAGPDESPPGHRAAEARQKAAALERWRGLAKAPSDNQQRFDVGFYGLDLALDPTAETVTGTVETRAEVLDGPLATAELDLDGALTVTAVRSASVPVPWVHAAGVLEVTLDRAYGTGESFAVEVEYAGTPDANQGAFGFDDYGGDPMIWSLSEPFGARTWWPCKDTPLDKADSAAVILTVPSNLVAISNGTLESTVSGGGTTTYTWMERYPITTYLISVAAHPYAEYTTTYTPAVGDPLPVTVWSFADDIAAAVAAAGTTVNMLETFASSFGEYPFLGEKYDQAQFLWGGAMEHQTATSICCWSEYLVAHELAHQWYGDAITCEGFSHIWINEGFATYAEALWAEANGGSSAYHQNILANRYFGAGTIYVPEDELDSVGRIFHLGLSYNKGSWVLHMLRGVVGDAAFFDILRAYSAEPGLAYGTASTEDFQAVAEAVSGMDLSSFFTGWIYQPYFPTYAFDSTFVDLGGSWRVDLDVRQLQAHHVYAMPVGVRIHTLAGPVDFVVQNDQPVQSYSLVVPTSPVSVELDPEEWILRTIEEKVESPTFHRGVLLVNGVDWGTYGSEITSAYADSTFSGHYPFELWDVFDEPGSGYVAELPDPIGHGSVPPEILGQFSTVVWVGNNYGGDLPVWAEAAVISYLEQGGNLLLLGRSGQNFLTPVRAAYAGIRWAENVTNTIQNAVSAHPSLQDMTRTGTQNLVAVFETAFDQPESQLLLTENTSFATTRALGVWRQPTGGGAVRPSGGHFAHVAGRPYRWDHLSLRGNVDAILAEMFAEPENPTGTGGATVPAVTRLHMPVPNPFNPRVELRFELERPGRVRLSVYDVRGRLVRVLLDEHRPAGEGRMEWDGRDGQGQPAASATYSFRLEGPGATQVRRATLVR